MQLGRPRYHRGIVLKRVVLFTLTVFFCLAGLCLARLCLAQDKPFKSEVREVLVPVTVTDDKGRFVSNLDAKDFRIYDEGQEQKIDYFSREHSQPVVVGFLLDMSNNMKIHWKTYQDAIIELIQGLLPGDKRYNGYLVTYGNDAELVVNTTDDPETMVQKIQKFTPGGGAALFDAIYKSCTMRSVIKGEPYEPRRVIVIVGDGHDTASKHSLEEVLELAQRNLVTIYAVSTAAFGFSSAGTGEETLTTLTEQTGDAWKFRSTTCTRMSPATFRPPRTKATTLTKWEPAATRRRFRTASSRPSGISPAKSPPSTSSAISRTLPGRSLRPRTSAGSR